MRNVTLRSAGGAALALVMALTLSGCTLITTLAAPEPTVNTSTTASPTESAEETPDESESASPTPTTAPTTAAGTTVGLEELAVGDCFDLDSEKSEATLFPDCDSLHLYEAFHSEDMAGGADFPGEEAVSTALDEICSREFPSFVGADPLQTDYDYTGVTPSEQSWAVEDREILCVVTPADERPTAGSAEGTAG